MARNNSDSRFAFLNKAFWLKIWRRFYDPIRSLLDRINQLTDGLLYRIFAAIDRFSKYGPHEAAALSYYALFSLFPLLLLVIVLGSSFFGTESARDQLSDLLSLFFPGDTAEILQNAVESTQDSRGSITIFSFIVLAWSSANLFGNLEKVMNRTFGIDDSRRFYDRRLVGLVIIFIFTIFLVASLLTNVIFSFLGLLYLNQFNAWLQMASLFVPAAFNAAIFAMIYGFLPRHHLRWDAILPVSLLGGAAFEIAKRLFVVYLSNLTTLDYVYGSVTTVVVFMLWTFYTFSILLIGAEICVALDDWMERPLRSLREQSRPPILLTEGQFPHSFFASDDE